MRLYNFFRSSTSHRLRIALRLKGLQAEYEPVDLRSEAHQSAGFKAVNPQGLVPALVKDGHVLIQSPAIIEWLEGTHPDPPLMPKDPDARARVRALAAIVGCDIHPLNNRRVLELLRAEFGADAATVDAWCARWIAEGFDAIETLLAADTTRGNFCFGHTPTVADIYLVPQVESARRFKVDLERWPNILAVDTASSRIEAFRLASPSIQPDAA